MFFPRQMLVATAVAVTLSSCSSATDVRAPQGGVVVRDTVVAATVNGTAGNGWLHFEVPLIVHNTGNTPLTIQFCASVVQVQRETSWEAAWSPVCAASAFTGLIIQPGETRDYTLPVTASLQGSGSPLWGDAGLNGRYRVAVGVTTPGFGGSIPHFMSGAFSLVTTP